MPDWRAFQRDDLDPAQLLRKSKNMMEVAYYGQQDRVAWKWHHYLEIYDRHLSRYRNRPVRILELGIYHGGSLQVWKTYFGESAIVHGLDIVGATVAVAEDRIVPHVGDQTDADLLRSIVAEMGGIDIVIDDAGHISAAQITTFEVLYPLLNKDGVYVCEDTHASYWEMFGGGYRRSGTFIEYAKGLVDELHAWYLDADEPRRDDAFARMTQGIFFYDSMVIFEKRAREKPFHLMVGQRTVAEDSRT